MVLQASREGVCTWCSCGGRRWRNNSAEVFWLQVCAWQNTSSAGVSYYETKFITFSQYISTPLRALILNCLCFRYVDSLRNSFADDDTFRLVVQMLYQLLLSNLWPFKHPKMVMIGPPDSGKSTWLQPILQIIDQRHLATCTEEKKFSCQMINNATQLVWMDEWVAGKLAWNFLISSPLDPQRVEIEVKCTSHMPT